MKCVATPLAPTARSVARWQSIRMFAHIAKEGTMPSTRPIKLDEWGITWEESIRSIKCS